MFNSLGTSSEEAKINLAFWWMPSNSVLHLMEESLLGLIELTTIFAGKQSIRDVIAFSKTVSSVSLMDNSPSSVEEGQMKYLTASGWGM